MLSSIAGHPVRGAWIISVILCGVSRQRESVQAMQAQPEREKSPWKAAQRILSKEGLKGFWKGWSPTAFRQGTNQMSMFTSYTWLRENYWGVKSKDALSSWQAASTGMVAGMVGPLLNCPADVVKTRLMNQTNSLVDAEQRYKGFYDATRRILLEEGPITQKGFS